MPDIQLLYQQYQKAKARRGRPNRAAMRIVRYYFVG